MEVPNNIRLWVYVKYAWNIGITLGCIVVIILDNIYQYPLEQTFYLIGIIGAIWYIINYLIDMFQPLPPMIVRRKDNERSKTDKGK